MVDQYMLPAHNLEIHQVTFPTAACKCVNNSDWNLCTCASNCSGLPIWFKKKKDVLIICCDRWLASALVSFCTCCYFASCGLFLSLPNCTGFAKLWGSCNTERTETTSLECAPNDRYYDGALLFISLISLGCKIFCSNIGSMRSNPYSQYKWWHLVCRGLSAFMGGVAVTSSGGISDECSTCNVNIVCCKRLKFY